MRWPLMNHTASATRRRWGWHVVGLILMVGSASAAMAGDQPVSANLPPAFALEQPPAYDPTLIDPAGLRAAMAVSGSRIVIVDVRSVEMYEMGHIAGAINVPGYNLIDHLGQVPLGVTLALYCS